MHQCHCTAFAHQYEHHETGMRIFDYTDANGVNRLYRVSKTDYFVPCVNDLATLKNFYTLTARNVLVVIHKLSGRMVRLASQREDFGIQHTVQEEAERIKSERWVSPLRVEFKGDIDTLNKIVEEIRRTPFDAFDMPLVVNAPSFDNSNSHTPPIHSNCPCFTVPFHFTDDLTPSHARRDAVMRNAREAVTEENKKREDVAVKSLRRHLENAIMGSPLPCELLLVSTVDRQVVLSWALDQAKAVIDKVSAGELKI